MQIHVVLTTTVKMIIIFLSVTLTNHIVILNKLNIMLDIEIIVKELQNQNYKMKAMETFKKLERYSHATT